LGAINMVSGAACTGARTMTSSSSPGISLMMEGLSYIAGTELPMVLVDVMRGGPGLGNIAPAQSDYNQVVHGGGHGDYHCIVLAPASVQESIDLTYEAFDLAEKYRAITVVLTDGSIGQMMEPAEMPAMRPLRKLPAEAPDWAVSGAAGRERRILSSIYLDPPQEEKANLRMLNRWQTVKAHEVRFKRYFMDDARYAVVGFGSAGRVALSAVRAARAEGIPVGLVRPITLSPFPEAEVQALAGQVESILVTEMNSGQMLEDVRRLVQGKVPVEFFGRLGGIMPLPDEILDEIRRMARGEATREGDPRQRWLDRMASLY
jgi:2-oxoglutarate ferredoxin oxidoreductase subunit alpha